VKAAIVCDWLVTYAGAERVLEQILKIYPEADLFCLVDFVPEKERGFLHGKNPKTTFLQTFPGAKKRYRSYLPLMPLAIEQLDVSGYDLVISSSHCVAKGIMTGPDQVHISYVHSPVRYAWDLQHQYLQEAGMTKGLKSWIARLILHYIRMWDYRTANGVDYFIGNSQFIARRIKKVYGREADVIYPPVNIDNFSLWTKKEDYYLTASRMVPYKKMRLIVEAFNQMPDKKLIVIGAGPEYEKTKAIAGKNVTMMGFQPFGVLKEKMQHARAFVFAAEEDFGITPVEAQACGTPVIAYGKGGSLETVRGQDKDNPTGIFFNEQTVESICDAVKRFEDLKTKILPEDCRKHAEEFSEERFRDEFKNFVESKL
jgi:glycosyltransferase involved in cell wall biosynthesis